MTLLISLSSAVALFSKCSLHMAQMHLCPKTAVAAGLGRETRRGCRMSTQRNLEGGVSLGANLSEPLLW